MQVAGYSPYTFAQNIEPTTPLQNSQVQGRQTQAVQQSETQNTVTASESNPQSISVNGVVTQVDEAEQADINPDSRGQNIDITV